MLRDPFSVLVVIENLDNQFLLLRRFDDPEFWQSVTGLIEPGETPIECAYREVFEETGINCELQNLVIHDLDITNQYQIRPQWRHRYKPGSLINTEYVFYLQVASQQDVVLCANEHTEYQWLSIEEAIKRVWSESNRAAIIAVNS